MSTTLETIFKITASVVGSNAIKSLANDVKAVSTNGAAMQRALNQGAMALKAFATSEAVLALRRIALSAIETGEQLNDLSMKSGVSVETLGRLKGAGEQAGLGLEEISRIAEKATKSMIAAQDATSKQAQAFAALGIDVRDAEGRLKSVDAVIFEMADSFKAHADGAGKTAIAMELLGKSGTDMIPVLNKGAEEIKALGIAVGPEFAARSDEFSDNMQKIHTQFEQLGIDLTNELLPGLIAMSEGWEKNNGLIFVMVQGIKLLESVFVGWQIAASTAVNAISTGFAVAESNAKGLLDTVTALKDMRFGDLDDIANKSEARKNAILAAGLREQAADVARYNKTLKAIWNNPVGTPAGGGAPSGNAGKPEIKWNPGEASKAAAEYERAARAADEWLVKQRESLITLKEEATYIGLTTIEVTKLKDARQFESEVAEKAAKMTKDQAAAFREQATSIEQARQKVLQYNYDQSRTFGAGAQEFFTKYAETASNSAEQIKTVLTNSFKAAEDALVEFTMTGKFRFKDFARSVIEDIVRMNVQRSITGPLSNMLSSFIGGFSPGGASFAMGGIMTTDGPVPLRAYARGGIANRPQAAIYGEGSTPEAYVPLPDGRSIPVTMKGSGAGAVNVNVVVNTSNGQESEVGNNQRMSEFGRAVAAAVKAEIIEQQRPGNLLAQA